MESLELAVHELLEINEFISEEIIGIKKISMTMDMPQDKDLKDFIKEYLDSKKTILENLQSDLSSKPANDKKEDKAMSDKEQLSDKDVFLDLLSSSKATINSLSVTLTATTNAQVRGKLVKQLYSYINSHRKILDMAISKKWYDPYADPKTQLQSELDAIGSMGKN